MIGITRLQQKTLNMWTKLSQVNWFGLTNSKLLSPELNGYIYIYIKWKKYSMVHMSFQNKNKLFTISHFHLIISLSNFVYLLLKQNLTKVRLQNFDRSKLNAKESNFKVKISTNISNTHIHELILVIDKNTTQRFQTL